MPPIFDETARRKPTNVRINSELLEKSKNLGINLSASLEQVLAEKVKSELQAQWQKENAGAIEAYNRFVQQHGMFSDSVRKF